MSMIDYGVVVIKNGVVTNKNQFFQKMRDAVGWDDCQSDVGGSNMFGDSTAADNYFAYIGDEDATMCFYKGIYRILNKNESLEHRPLCWSYTDRRKSDRVEFNGMKIHVTEITHRVYLADVLYKGDSYHVVFGYGIDPNFSVYNKIKVQYLGIQSAKRVDKIFKRYLNKDEYQSLIKEKYTKYIRRWL